MSQVDSLLKGQKLHIDQLMLDERVAKLVGHVADHAFQQGHNRTDPPPITCKKCEELLNKIFPNHYGETP